MVQTAATTRARTTRHVHGVERRRARSRRRTRTRSLSVPTSIDARRDGDRRHGRAGTTAAGSRSSSTTSATAATPTTSRRRTSTRLLDWLAGACRRTSRRQDDAAGARRRRPARRPRAVLAAGCRTARTRFGTRRSSTTSTATRHPTAGPRRLRQQHLLWSRTSDAHTGSYAERLDVTNYVDGDNKLDGQVDLGFCEPTVTPGHQYRITEWYKSTRAGLLHDVHAERHVGVELLDGRARRSPPRRRGRRQRG